MCVFLFGVGTEAGKGGREGRACSSPLPVLAKGSKCRKKSGWKIRERKNISGGSAVFFISLWNSAEQLQSHYHSLTFSGVGCLCLITRRALCKRRRDTHLHTSLQAGENSHTLGAGGGRPSKGEAMDIYGRAARACGQEHQASWANSSQRAHNFPVKQTDGWVYAWMVQNIHALSILNAFLNSTTHF